jgi:FkbM family methyltransferase
MTLLSRTVAAFKFQLNKRLKLDIVRISSQQTLMAHLLRVFQTYGIDTVLDVGANEGQFARLIRKWGYSGEIHSFEPVKSSYSKLSEHASRDRAWRVHNFALGNKPGTAKINVLHSSTLSSMLNINSFATRKWVDDTQFSHQEEVTVRTLDDFIADHDGIANKRIFLKLDTQGYDLEVFRGADRSLDQVCCLLSEVSLIPIYDGMPTYLEALSAYQSRGFSISGIYPLSKNEGDLSVIEMDCVLVNKRLFSALPQRDSAVLPVGVGWARSSAPR